MTYEHVCACRRTYVSVCTCVTTTFKHCASPVILHASCGRIRRLALRRGGTPDRRASGRREARGCGTLRHRAARLTPLCSAGREEGLAEGRALGVVTGFDVGALCRLQAASASCSARCCACRRRGRLLLRRRASLAAVGCGGTWHGHGKARCPARGRTQRAVTHGDAWLRWPVATPDYPRTRAEPLAAPQHCRLSAPRFR
jgi:hypothetical protein